MKTTTILLLLFLGIQLQAQDSSKLNKFWNNTEIGFFWVGEYRDFLGGQIKTTTSYRILPRLSLGFTTGIDGHQVALLPLLTHIRWQFAPTKRVNPYLGASIGGGISLAKKTEFSSSRGGFTGEISSGVQVNRGEQSGFSLALAYRYQEFSVDNLFCNVGSPTDCNYRIGLLSFRFGWHF